MDAAASSETDSATAVSADQIAALRRAAEQYVLRATSCVLDGSEESLAFVDHYLDKVRGGPPPQTEVQRLIAAAIGGYLGELLIARFGGRWVAIAADSEDEDAADQVVTRWRVDLSAVPLRVDPIGMAAAALSHAEADETGLMLRPPDPPLQEALAAALSRLAPVDEDYYYSLTGRFETLSYAVDILSELLQQRASGSLDAAASRPDTAEKTPPVRRTTLQ